MTKIRLTIIAKCCILNVSEYAYGFAIDALVIVRLKRSEMK